MKDPLPTRWRSAAAVSAAWLPAAVLLGTTLVWWSRLPETVPTHWDGVGLPDGFSSRTATWSWLFAVAVLAGLTAVAAVLVRGRTPAGARGLLGLAGGTGGFAAAIWLVSATTTLAGGDPEAARLGWHLGWLPVGLAWAAVPYGIAGRTPVRPIPISRSAAGLTLAPGEHAAWMVTLRPRLLVTAAALGILAVAVVAVTIESWVWPVTVVPLLALALFWEVQVTVDHRGLRVVAGLLGLPLKRIPVAGIASASAEHIDPTRWGGWGYRILPGRSALVLRSGPGLVLQLRDGRRFAVTVEDPDTPAALLATLRGSVRPA